MSQPSEQRSAGRVALGAAARVEKLGPPAARPHAALAPYYERVWCDESGVGTRFDAVVSDISEGGAFLAGPPLPLLSRIAIAFDLPDHGPVQAIGWILWRRTADVALPPDAGGATLGAGCGVLFEAIPLAARGAIAQRAAR